MSVAKVKSQYIYRFYNENNQCLYVGKTIHLKPRFLQHKQKEWWDQVYRIEYAELPKGREFMVDLYEVYYINSSKPKYNAKDINVKYMVWSYPLLEFKNYDIGLINK
jgi:excinuclease UvrABC nuclease subunit